MFYRIFFWIALLSTGDSSVQSERVVAFAGEDLILPCSVTNPDRDHVPDFEWSKEGLEPNVIFLYRQGCETFEMKHPDFEFRTSPFMKEIKNGNISLRISNVKLSDAGKYKCLRLTKKDLQTVGTMELLVVSVSEPKLSMIWADSGTVTVQCEARCWLPEPEMTFLDDQGNNITAGEPETERDARGCYTLRQNITLRSPTRRVKCTVSQLEFKQIRSAEIFIPGDCMTSNLYRNIAYVEAILLVFIGGFGVFWFLRNRKGFKCDQGKKLVRTEVSKEIPLLEIKSDMADNMGDHERENLRQKMDVLKKKISEKDKEIQQLKDQIKSQKHHIVCQHNKPAIAHRSSKSESEPTKVRLRRNNTSAPSNKKDIHVRSRSEPYSYPEQNGTTCLN